ncbi:MAG: hypothetical protein ACE5FP_01745 [Gemmatimonadota bacterium]
MTNQSQDRTETSFEARGALAPPGWIGRVVRLASGAWLLSGFLSAAQYGWAAMVQTSPPTDWRWWAFAVLSFWLLPYVVNIGFTRNWRRKPQVVVALAFAAAVIADLLVWGTWWAPPAGVLVWTLIIYFSAHLGVSFVLSGVIATPGCEMRSLPHLWTLLTGRDTREHYCPGVLDRLDRWEAGLKRR